MTSAGAARQGREAPTVVPTLDGRFRRYKIVHDGRVVACFNPASDRAASFLLRRPSLHPLYTPRGLPVTEQGAHNYPHHKGVFLVLGRVNTTELYSDLLGTTGHQATRAVHWRTENGCLVLEATVAWLDASDHVLIEEQRVHRVFVSDQAHRIDVDSRLQTPLPDGVDLPRNKHGYFHCRVIDAIDEDDGGTVRASSGLVGADRIVDTEGFWIDTRGQIGPSTVGVAIMVHPRYGPQPLFARTYGTVALNPFAVSGRHLAVGAVYRNVYSVWAYDRPEAFDVARAFETFASTAVLP